MQEEIPRIYIWKSKKNNLKTYENMAQFRPFKSF